MNSMLIIKISIALAVLCLTWFIIRWKKKAQQHLITRCLEQKKAIDPSLVHAMGRILTVVILVFAAMVFLHVLGVSVAPLLAVGGIGAAALGFAAKDVIANFFGGLMLAITRPFSLDDYIALPDRSVEGIVEEIDWYLTRIRDREKRAVYLPNSLFSTMLVVNHTRMSHRHIDEKITVRFEDFAKVNQLVDDIRQMLQTHPAIDQTLPILVHFSAKKEYFVEISIDAYSTETRYNLFLDIKEEIMLRTHQIIASRGAQTPLPTQSIELVKE